MVNTMRNHGIWVVPQWQMGIFLQTLRYLGWYEINQINQSWPWIGAYHNKNRIIGFWWINCWIFINIHWGNVGNYWFMDHEWFAFPKVSYLVSYSSETRHVVPLAVARGLVRIQWLGGSCQWSCGVTVRIDFTIVSQPHHCGFLKEP